MQFDKSSTNAEKMDWKKNIFISSASFKYPTLKTKELKKIPILEIANENQLIRVPRGAHSVKPSEIRDAIERMFPTQGRAVLKLSKKNLSEEFALLLASVCYFPGVL